MTFANRLEEAIALVEACKFDDLDSQTVYLTKDGLLALLYTINGQTGIGQSHAVEAQAFLKRRMEKTPITPRVALHTAEVESVLGNQQEVRRLLGSIFSNSFGQCDAFERPYFHYFASIAAKIEGDDRSAFTYLSEALAEPGHLSAIMAQRHPILRTIQPISGNH